MDKRVKTYSLEAMAMASLVCNPRSVNVLSHGWRAILVLEALEVSILAVSSWTFTTGVAAWSSACPDLVSSSRSVVGMGPDGAVAAV